MTLRKNRQAIKKKIRPYNSVRRQILVKKLSEVVRTGKGFSMGALLREAGYSKRTSLKPTRITRNPNFQELLEINLPDREITKTHHDNLKASTIQSFIFPRSEDDKNIEEIIRKVPGVHLIRIQYAPTNKRAYCRVPDNVSQMKAVAEAYKVKGKYPSEKQEVSHNVKVVEVIYYGGKPREDNSPVQLHTERLPASAS